MLEGERESERVREQYPREPRAALILYEVPNEEGGDGGGGGGGGRCSIYNEERLIVNMP